MYKAYAHLSRRMNDMNNSIETTRKEYDALLEERNTLAARYFHDFEIGAHIVPGGEIIVTIGPGGSKRIVFCPVDEETQKFARCYSGHCTTVARAVAARDKYYRAYRDQLVNGTYIVDGGTTTVTSFGAVFHANP